MPVDNLLWGIEVAGLCAMAVFMGVLVLMAYVDLKQRMTERASKRFQARFDRKELNKYLDEVLCRYNEHPAGSVGVLERNGGYGRRHV